MIGTLSEFIPASWFHPIGIHKVLNQLYPRLPDVSGSLFLTLTVDPKSFQDETSGFIRARDRIRRMLSRLRKGVKWEGKWYQIDSPYCVKVEFHENGWPHFHIVLLTRRFLPAALLYHLWDYGWTDVRRIQSDEFHYLLKYVTKAQEIPIWVRSFARLRVFQPSRGFLLPKEESTAAAEPLKPRKKRRDAGCIGDRLDHWSRTAKLKTDVGTVETVKFSHPFKQILDHLVIDAALDGRYLGSGKVEISEKKEILLWEMKAKQLKRNLESSSPDSSYPAPHD